MALSANPAADAAATYDVAAVRRDFPILSREVNGYPLVYLDNAASAQKPNAVIDAVANQSRLEVTSASPPIRRRIARRSSTRCRAMAR